MRDLQHFMFLIELYASMTPEIVNDYPNTGSTLSVVFFATLISIPLKDLVLKSQSES